MTLLSKLFFSVPLAICVLTCQAQGYCPPGQYPVSGQGWSYCAGTPDSQDNAAAATQRAQPHWVNKWLSITLDANKGVLSTATSTISGNDAETSAMIDCQRQGGASCKANGTVLNGCLAMAIGSGYIAVGAASTKREAEDQAITKCNGGDGQCHIYHSECALPERVN